MFIEEREKVKVIDIQFAYNNHEAIKLLQRRGYAITTCNWDALDAINLEIDALVKG